MDISKFVKYFVKNTIGLVKLLEIIIMSDIIMMSDPHNKERVESFLKLFINHRVPSGSTISIIKCTHIPNDAKNWNRGQKRT